MPESVIPSNIKISLCETWPENYSNGRSAYFGRMFDLIENVADINQSGRPGVYDANLECLYCGIGFDAEIKTE